MYLNKRLYAYLVELALIIFDYFSIKITRIIVNNYLSYYR